MAEQTHLTEIITSNGRYFDLADPENAIFHIEDIATALSNICRYAGHVPRFYSVAEHSVLMAMEMPAHLRFEALMHDAAEAYIGDVSRPLKYMLPDYKALEQRVETALRKQFGLPDTPSPEIKQFDMRMLAMEKEAVLRCDDFWVSTEGIEPLNIQPHFWEPGTAASFFLDQYHHLENLRFA